MGFGNSSEMQMEQTKKHVDYCSGPCHAEQILQVLNNYRQNGIFTDVVLQVGTVEFPCHRAALSANSIYFRAMFHSNLKESCQDKVKIHDISPSNMEALLNFMYEGKVDIHEDNVESIFLASDHLQINVVRDACVKFLEKQIDPSNCLGILKLARSFSVHTLTEKCTKFLFEDFAEVFKHEEFLLLSDVELVEFLCSERLTVEHEAVVDAVIRWLHHDVPARKVHLKNLLALVQLPLLDPVYFVNKIEMDEVIMKSEECWPLLQEARRYHIFGNEVMSTRTHPRRFLGMTEMLVVIGGCDKKGFFQLSCTEKYNFETKKWTPAATVPGGLKSEFAVCTLQNDIYVSGGHINSKAVWRYMSKLDAWVQVAPLNKGRWRHKMVALQGKIYVVGGFDGNGRVASVECYNSFTNEWHPVAALLEAVSSAAVTTCHNKLFVIGGAVNDQTNTNQVQCYDPDEDKWIHMAPTPFYLRCLNAVTLDKTIYVVGGLMEKMYSYVPEKNLWSEAVTLPGPLESCGMAICHGKMYILGGRNEQGMGTDKVFSFEPSSGEFTEEPPMPRCLIYHGCVTVTQPLKKNLKL
ncbi:kelch-like protein 35 [Polypterus senegalus]|uniref:kelch-like protein 35 n=1 Tax=Polypterus senegalus TaxID=55291 RepID=UPI0019624749|nr:kelch-like protein 35 [Polypterus senegalus]